MLTLYDIQMIHAHIQNKVLKQLHWIVLNHIDCDYCSELVHTNLMLIHFSSRLTQNAVS
jgi:hypothetical protein